MNRVVVLLLVLVAATSLAQHQEPGWSARTAVIDEQRVENDSLCNVLHNMGTFEGHIRTFFMGTTNRQSFPDYYALAVGGGLGYYSPIIKNFQAGMSGFIIYNLASTHLGPQPPFNNRYEVGLFEVRDPDNHDDLDRLEDLYLRYYFSQESNSFLQVGKFHLKTPMINLQDGRMRPNLQEGAWSEWSVASHWSIKAGWIWRTSPRGSIRWYQIGESLGVYPMGRAVNGNPAAYSGVMEIPGIAVGSFGYKSKVWNVQLWNYHVTGLMNTLLPKVEWTLKGNHHRWSVGAQVVDQRSLSNNTVPLEQQYTTRGERARAISVRVSQEQTQTSRQWSLNYTRITAEGRFLFPREWGVEPFYTFMYRERTEGAGDVHAGVIQHRQYLDQPHRLSMEAGVGVFLMPDVTNAALNKYAMADFYQLNLRTRYKFKGFLHGLQADLLYTFKGNLDNDLEPSPGFFHNKVDMHHLSLVMDYYF